MQLGRGGDVCLVEKRSPPGIMDAVELQRDHVAQNNTDEVGPLQQ